MSGPVPGSCLCGAVRFTITPPTLFCGNCHCSICRRSHGAAFVAWFGVARDQFELVSGANQLARFSSTDDTTRSFCGRCGSSLFSESRRHSEQIEVVLASMQGPIDRIPEAHVFYDDRAPWTTVEDGLPRMGGTTGFEPLEPDHG